MIKNVYLNVRKMTYETSCIGS